MCDRACRDCARVAGMMSTPTSAKDAMNASLLHHQTSAPGWVITSFTAQLVVFEDFIRHNPSLSMPSGSSNNHIIWKFWLWNRRCAFSQHRFSWSLCNGSHQSNCSHSRSNLFLWSALSGKPRQPHEFSKRLHFSNYKYFGTSGGG